MRAVEEEEEEVEVVESCVGDVGVHGSRGR
jgi:hypothetical protein